MINTIWVSCAPRTGSMWTYNVTREICRITGHNVKPTDVPQSDNDMIKLAQTQAHNSDDPQDKWILKVHKILAPNIPRSKIITTHRDPRDVLVSFQEFMKSTFEAAFDFGRWVVKYTTAYKDYDPDYLFMVAYADIEQRPAYVIQQIAGFIDADISPDQADTIAAKFSRQKVKQIIERADQKMEQAKETGKIDRREVVILSEKNYRAFDLQSGFQSGHVSSRKTGDWAKVLDEAQRKLVDAEFANWLADYGYNTDES